MTTLRRIVRDVVDLKIAPERETCRVLGVTRSVVQRRDDEPPCDRELSDGRLLPMIVSIFKLHRRRYGARRIAAELDRRGIRCGRRRVAKLLKVASLTAIQPRSFKPRSTESRHGLGYNENLLLDTPEPSAIDQLWVGDITYIPVHTLRWMYLSVLMDRYSRRIVGWSLRRQMDESLVTESLRRSIRSRRIVSPLIHHTDRGGQYASKGYRAILKRSSMRQSMSRAGDCYDNAFMESCFGSIKTELEMVEYDSEPKARESISNYLEYYNNDRLHSSIGYMTPVEFESNQSKS